MDIDRLQSLALEIRDLYRESNEREEKATWDARAYADGLLVDVAALMKLLMIHDDLRDGAVSREQLAHELSDVVWSAFVIADELEIDLAMELPEQFQTLRRRFY